MTRGGLSAAAILVSATAGCDRGSDERRALERPATVYNDENLVAPRPVNVEGCLTGSGDRFVLTSLQQGVLGPEMVQQRGERAGAAPQPTTETYRLVGMEDELRNLVGQRIAVTGEAEPEQLVYTREVSPPLEPSNAESVGTSGPDPQVSTVGAARIEISDLRVWSARATGEACLEST